MKKRIISIFLTIISFCFCTNVYALDYIKITPSKLTMQNYTSTNIKVSGPNGETVSGAKWTSSNPNIVTVNNGVITAKGIGSAIITASYNSFKATCTITVTNSYIPVTDIKINSALTIYKGNTQNINAQIIPSNASNQQLTYTSSNPNVATIDSNGNIKAISDGITYISVVSQDYRTTCTVKVISTLPLKGISIQSELEILETNTQKLNVTYNPNNATNKKVTWKSSDSSIATVDESGNVTGIKEGEVTITAVSAEGGYVATSKVKVNKIDKTLKGITLNKTELKIKKGEEETLTVTFSPEYAENKNVIWKSSNSLVASIDNGKITANSAGTAEITVTSAEGNFTSTCNVTVTSLPIENISFDSNSTQIYLNTTSTLKTIPTPEDSVLEDPIWTSSDETIVKVENGKITGISIGMATISVSNQDGSIKASIDVSVIKKPQETLKITVEGYDINFDPKVKEYDLKIKKEKSLNIKTNYDSSKVTISGNNDLADGSVINITVRDKQKKVYTINIHKNKDYTIYIIGAISLILLINIIRIIAKKNKKSKLK